MKKRSNTQPIFTTKTVSILEYDVTYYDEELKSKCIT
jgi:hypothetical protein